MQLSAQACGSRYSSLSQVRGSLVFRSLCLLVDQSIRNVGSLMHAFVSTQMDQNPRVKRIRVYLLQLPTKNSFASWSWVVAGLRDKVTLRLLSYYLPSRIL